MKSGELAYITKRIDRDESNKIHMEDMAQLTNKLTKDKYKSSHERIAKAIQKFSNSPFLDIVNFAEQVLFSFLTANADMHLKNFSLINNPKLGYILSPAYDMLSTRLIIPIDDDPEDLALTLNGKKQKITKNDFKIAFKNFGLNSAQQENIFEKMLLSYPKWQDLIAISFLSDDFKEAYSKLIEERFCRLGFL